MGPRPGEDEDRTQGLSRLPREPGRLLLSGAQVLVDRELYGVSEFWATPREFMKRSGDCEDYSIAKFFVLRDLGFSNDQLRIVILKDRIRGIGHAVLAVYALGDILILDSLSDLIFSHRKYRHYVPQYSMNETTRWAHFYAKKRTASL